MSSNPSSESNPTSQSGGVNVSGDANVRAGGHIVGRDLIINPSPSPIDYDALRQKYLVHVVGEWQKIKLIGFSHGRRDTSDPLLEDIFVQPRLKQEIKANGYYQTKSLVSRNIAWGSVKEREGLTRTSCVCIIIYRLWVKNRRSYWQNCRS